MLNYHTFPGFELLNLGFTYQFLFHYLNWELNPYEDGMGQWRSIFFTYQFGGKISVYLYYNFLFLVISSPFSPISSSPNIKKYSLYQKAYSENSSKILYWIRKTRVYQNIFHLYHSFKWSYLVIAPTSKKERHGTL